MPGHRHDPGHEHAQRQAHKGHARAERHFQREGAHSLVVPRHVLWGLRLRHVGGHICRAARQIARHQLVERAAEQVAQLQQLVHLRIGTLGLPLGNGLTAHAQKHGKLLLCQVARRTQVLQVVAKAHGTFLTLQDVKPAAPRDGRTTATPGVKAVASLATKVADPRRSPHSPRRTVAGAGSLAHHATSERPVSPSCQHEGPRSTNFRLLFSECAWQPVVSHAWSEARRPEDVHGTPSRAHKAPYPQPARKAFAPRADRPRGHRQMRCPSVLAAHAAAYRHAADARRRLVACRRSSRRRAVRVPTGKRAPQAFVSQTKPASPFRKQIPAGARLQADPCERLTAAPPPASPGQAPVRPPERTLHLSVPHGRQG